MKKLLHKFGGRSFHEFHGVTLHDLFYSAIKN